MSKLRGYLARVKGGPVLSTIGFDMFQRKRIEPTKFDSWSAAQTIYVRECLTHENSQAVPVDLYDRTEDNDRWNKVGESYCCPLCWGVLKLETDPTKWKSTEKESPTVDESGLRLKKPRKRKSA